MRLTKKKRNQPNKTNQKLGKYKMIKTLGEGFSATVKLAKSEEDNKQYAVKILYLSGKRSIKK